MTENSSELVVNFRHKELIGEAIIKIGISKLSLFYHQLQTVKDFIKIFFMKLIIMKPTALIVSLLMLFMRISRDHHIYETNRSFSPLRIKSVYKDFVA